jgi:hypothetical protein
MGNVSFGYREEFNVDFFGEMTIKPARARGGA